MDAEDMDPGYMDAEDMDPGHREPEQRQVRWQDFSPVQQVTIIAAALVELSLLVAALVDLKRRPVEQVRGRKGVWVAVSFVNLVGPISYFAFGRKR